MTSEIVTYITRPPTKLALRPGINGQADVKVYRRYTNKPNEPWKLVEIQYFHTGAEAEAFIAGMEAAAAVLGEMMGEL